MASKIHPGGKATATLSAQDTYTPPILLNNCDAFIDIKTTALSGSLVPQYSDDYDAVAATGTWVDISGKIWTGDASENVELDAPLWFRIGFKTGGYSSGSAIVTIRRP